MQNKILLKLQYNFDKLLCGDNSIISDTKFYNEISEITVHLINNPVWNNDDTKIADLILRISNILYNNSSIEILPLDDGLYDQLLVIYKRYDPNYQVGAYPVFYEEKSQNEIFNKKEMVTLVDRSKIYTDDIYYQNCYLERPVNMVFTIRDPITKRLINTTHKYPELVGTLDKCKFVLNQDARDKDVYDKPSVQIFERDYIHKCLDKGVIKPDEIFDMVGELKYDGVSVEAEVQGDTIISALSRGDTADNIASDLTPILGGYVFPFANKVPKDVKFGIKFEAIITKKHLDELSIIRGKGYKNCRNAIIGLFGASDAYKFIDYITLIPLSCSLELDRIDELKFLNKYYNSGEYNRYIQFRGNYQQILFQIKQFVESAEAVRIALPYMIDGVVISFTDKNKIDALGRENSVNKYQMAIKFNPKKVRTIFLGYTYSIGKSGDIIPMVHFKACEFIGAIHTKQTIHSYERFKKLNLAIGEQIDIEYVNDVISYVTKPDTEYNRTLGVEPEKFIENCPCCGTKLFISDSGKSIKCNNPYCDERQIMRMVDMFDKLGFKDISEESIRLINAKSLNELIQIYYHDQERFYILGPKTSATLINYIHNFISGNIILEDYKIMSAMCFNNMADEKWKTILKHFTIDELKSMNEQELYNNLVNINGIGPSVVQAIITGFDIYSYDINILGKQIKYFNSKGKAELPKVAFTGFRDQEYTQLLIDNGFDANDKYTVTKNLYALIAADKNNMSGKIKKAIDYGIKVYSKDEFIKVHNIKL